MKFVIPIILLALALPAPACADDYTDGIDAWHAGRIERLQQPGSWLTLVGLFALPEGRSTIGTSTEADLHLDTAGPPHIGDIVLTGLTAMFIANAPSTHEGEPVYETELAADTTGAPTVIETGSISFYLIVRHGRPYLRVKDANAPLRMHFEGIERWPVDESWRIEARWVEYDEPQVRVFPDVLGVAEEAEVTGEARFTIDGTDYVLYPNSVGDDWMYWVFGDTTNGIETYGGGRFYYSDLPDEEGRLILDFNRCYNPPCVFTPYATCPLPADDNVLDLEITAGEKMWGAAH